MVRATGNTARAGLVALVASVPLALAGCDFARRERLLVWHDWPDPEAAVLVELLSGHEELDPDLDLVVEFVPDDEIESRISAEVRSGFGPDVLIGVDAERLSGLAESGALHPIGEEQIEAHRTPTRTDSVSLLRTPCATSSRLRLDGVRCET